MLSISMPYQSRACTLGYSKLESTERHTFKLTGRTIPSTTHNLISYAITHNTLKDGTNGKSKEGRVLGHKERTHVETEGPRKLLNHGQLNNSVGTRDDFLSWL